MKAIILSAGQGKRLLPITEDTPKCLLRIDDQTIIEYQINTLSTIGIEHIVVVTGFKSLKVENYLKGIYKNTSLDIKYYYNPFYAVSDNLATCWIVREEFDRDFFIINGDDLFEGALVKKLLETDPYPVTVAMNIKSTYDTDDMKVVYNEKTGKLQEVSKLIDCNKAKGEAIGIHLFRDEGVNLFKNTVEELMREPSGLKKWYLSAINALAKKDAVNVCNITGFKWIEVDYPDDLVKAKELIKDIIVPTCNVV